MALFALLRRFYILAPALAGAAIILLDLAPGGPIDAARQWGFDAWQRIAPSPRTPDVVIVDIDEAALHAAGRWPWPRAVLARLLPPLAPARAVGIDILLRDQDNAGPTDDQALADALRKVHAVLAVGGAPQPLPSSDVAMRPATAVTLVRERGIDPAIFLPRLGAALPPLASFAAVAGGLGISTVDSQAPVVRELPAMLLVQGAPWPGFVAEVLRVAAGAPDMTIRTGGGGVEAVEAGAMALPTTSSGAILPRFAYARHVPHVSAARLLTGDFPPGLFDNRVVLLGVAAAGAGHVLASPLGIALSPMDVEAAAIQAALDHRLLQRPIWLIWLERLASLLLAGCVALLVQPGGHRRAGFVLAGSLAATPALALWCFAGPGLLVDWVLPAVAMTATWVVAVWRLAAISAEAHVREAQAQAAGEREAGLRQAADAARQSLSLALDAARLGVWDADVAAGTWHCSPQFGPILGLATLPPTWSAPTMLADIQAEDHPAVSAALAGLAGDRFDVECRAGAGRAQRDVRIVGQVWRDVGGGVARIAGAVADITRERALERQVRLGERMQAIGLLAGGVAHNFNNLLTVIIGKLDLARRYLPLEGPAAAQIDGAASAVERATQVVRHLLVFARGQTVETRPTDVTTRLRDVATLLRDTLPRSLRLELDLADDLGSVRVDPTELDLAILNIALNARDAMRGGGRIRIVARRETVARPNLALAGIFVVIAVSDDGPGVPAAVIDRVFEPFVTTKAPSAGTGLGLSQVHGFASQAGGATEIETAPGAGTTVRLFLPPCAPAEGAMAESGADDAMAVPGAMPGRGTRGTILLVEDELDLAVVAADILTAEGYEVQAAHSGAQALSVLRAGRKFDLMFSDIVMPGGLSGTDLAAIARQEFPAMRILLTTGYSQDIANGGGATMPLLRKPYRADELCDKVAQLFAAPHPMTVLS